jgi:hypothetical protein
MYTFYLKLYKLVESERSTTCFVLALVSQDSEIYIYTFYVERSRTRFKTCKATKSANASAQNGFLNQLRVRVSGAEVAVTRTLLGLRNVQHFRRQNCR